jgi:uncharacterized protein
MKSLHRLLDPSKPADLRKGLCALGVMTKAPRAGIVKTRLTPPLKPEEAAALNTCFLRDLASSIMTVASSGNAQGIAVYTPLGAERDYSEILPVDFALIPQRGENLSERLIHAFQDLFSHGFESVCLIGSDSPTIPTQIFSEAAHVLSEPEARLVLGPSDDGGYYLIGLQQRQPTLFENIEWSTERVLEQTIERAKESELKIHLLPTWYDVDDGATLRRLCQELFSPPESNPEAFPAPATRAYLAELLKSEGRARIWPA